MFLTIVTACLSKNANIVSSFPGLQEKGEKYLRAVANANGFSMDRIKVIGMRSPYLAKNNLIQRKVKIVL